MGLLENYEQLRLQWTAIFWRHWTMPVGSIWRCLRKGIHPNAHLSDLRFIRRVPALIECRILSMPSVRRWVVRRCLKRKFPVDSFEISPFLKVKAGERGGLFGHRVRGDRKQRSEGHWENRLLACSAKARSPCSQFGNLVHETFRPFRMLSLPTNALL